MIVVDPGHAYGLAELDSGRDSMQLLKFVKREGEGYPGNVGHYPGTQIQEVLRACIDRIKYVDNQIPHLANKAVLQNLRITLHCLEIRAAERHGKILRLSTYDDIELLPVGENGHLLCGAGEE
jgi:hypothetical protein